MKSKGIILVCKAVRFGSQFDEDALFEWIKKIDCIDSTSASGRELYLHISTTQLHDYNLRDLLALFMRYKIDMKQLRIFLTEDNKKWFYDNKKAYWHKKVFGKETLSKKDVASGD